MNEAHGVHTETGLTLLEEKRLHARAVEASQLQGAERWKDVQPYSRLVALACPRLEAGAQPQPAFRVLPDCGIRIDSGRALLARGRKRSSQRILRFALGVVRLSTPAPGGVPVIENPAPAPLPDASHPLSPALATRDGSPFAASNPLLERGRANAYAAISYQDDRQLSSAAHLSRVMQCDAEPLRYLRHGEQSIFLSGVLSVLVLSHAAEPHLGEQLGLAKLAGQGGQILDGSLIHEGSKVRERGHAGRTGWAAVSILR